MKFLKILWERLVLQATLPEIKLALSSKSRDLLSHVISECMQMRGRIYILLAVKPSLNSCWIITERMVACTVMKLIVCC